MPLPPPPVRLIAGATLCLASALAAQAPSVMAGPSLRGPHDAAEVEAFIDGVMTAYLRDKHVAGATVTVVRDTSVLLTKGYGWADVEQRIPVDGARTLFRNGSITKTFTWTAVMQLVEQGKLDLDADVNTYLDFRIPATYPQPITLRHILTHTPGLEEDVRELFTEDSARIRPLKEWLPAHMPGRVRPPGSFASYSNWAAATAGYIVERVSGMPYDAYLEEHIFKPLGMVNASTRQPLSAALRPQMSKGYVWDNGRWEEKKWEIVTGAWPAGSMSISAGDMALWMLAHLNDGAWRGQRILAESTAVRMRTRLQGHDPRLPGLAHGFYEQTTVGPRAVGHGGDTQWFHSDMMLLPEEKVGVFVSFNTDKGSEVSFKPFTDVFLEHYYPEPLPPLQLKSDARQANQRFAGEYLMNRMSFTTFQKAAGLAGAVRISVADSGALVASTAAGDVRFVQVDSLLFRDVASHDLLAFQLDAGGRVTRAFLSRIPILTFEKTSALGAPSLHLILLGVGLLVSAGVLVAAITRAVKRRGVAGQPDGALVKRARSLLTASSLLIVTFGIALLGVAGNAEQMLLSGELGALKAVLVLPVLAAVLTLACAIMVALLWMRGAGTAGVRLRYSLAVLVAAVFFWSLNTWNLLGWRM